MKRISLVLAIVSALIIFPGCVHFSGLQTRSWQKYQNKQMGFEVKTPPGWNVDEETTNFVRLFSADLGKNKYHVGVPTEGMWVDISPTDRCLPDPKNDFYRTNYASKDGPAKNLFQRFICKGNLEIQVCFWSYDSKGKEGKELAVKILDSIRSWP